MRLAMRATVRGKVRARMRAKVRMTFLLLLAMFAAPLAGPVRAQAPGIAPSDILDAAIGDWNKDGREDLALLAVTDRDDMQVGLYVYLRGAETDGRLLTLVLTVPDKIWGARGGEGGAFGQEPSIKALANGSIAITTQNFGIGRERWEHTLSLAYRDGRFLVAGLTFSSFDSLQEEEPLTCDLNLLTGRGIVNDKPVRFAPLSLTFDRWETTSGEDPGIRICRGRQ